mgnify:CR=1 FL=1
MKKYHDIHAKNLPSLDKGQHVRVRDGKTWPLKGKVMEKAQQPRSYIVKTEKGSFIRRNRKGLLASPEMFEPQEMSDIESEIPTSSGIKETSQLHLRRTDVRDNNNEQCVRTRSGRVVKPPAYLRNFVH